MPTIYTTKQLPPRDGREFYPTNRRLVIAALSYLDIPAPTRILDPGSGSGVWGKVARRLWPDAHIMGVDKYFHVGPRQYDTWWGNDFLAVDIPYQFDLVMGNPPYRKDWPERFVKKSYDLLKPGGTLIFLLSHNFTHSRGRANRLFADIRPTQINILAERPSFTGNGKTNAEEYDLFIWQKGFTGEAKVIWGFSYLGSIDRPANANRYRPPLPVGVNAESVAIPVFPRQLSFIGA
jgi:SAM-dependent methyltransferase